VCDAKNPGSKRGVLVETLDVLVNLYTSILHDILSLFSITQYPESRVINTVLISPNQGLEESGVPRLPEIIQNGLVTAKVHSLFDSPQLLVSVLPF
jgi:hypothetical protein